MPPVLKITYLNVGQGDCTLIKCPNGTTLMVDCGSAQGANDDTLRNYKEERDKWALEVVKYKRMKTNARPKDYAKNCWTRRPPSRRLIRIMRTKRLLITRKRKGESIINLRPSCPSRRRLII